jgi:uncharacterized protein (TIGR02145 family)
MKKRRQFIQLLLIAGLLFVAVAACDKSDDPGGDTPSAGKLKDADGNVYKTVEIGSQVWMAENLKTTKYNDSIEMPNVTSDTLWVNLTTGAYCNYQNLESNADTYGRLYNCYAVNSGKLAPTGWHVPTDEDWTILENYLISNGYNYDGTKEEDKVAKSLCSKTGWATSFDIGTPNENPDENDSTGFTALPGGIRNDDGNFYDIRYVGRWWSSTEDGTHYRYLRYDDVGLRRSGNIGCKGCGLSVRLVRD